MTRPTHPAPRARAIRWPALPRIGALRTASADILLTLLLCLIAAALLLRPLDDRLSITIGNGDGVFEGDFHAPEISSEDGRPFRWTRARSLLLLAAQGNGPHLLSLRAAAPQSPAPATTPLSISVAQKPLATLPLSAQPRRYTLLVPAEQIRWGGNEFAFESPLTRLPGDPRELGVVVFDTSFTTLTPATWLPPLQVAVLTLAALLLSLALRRMGVGTERLLIVALFVAISLSMRHSDARFSQRWEALQITATIGAVAAGACLLRRAPAAAPAVASHTPTPRRAIWGTIALFALLSALPLAQLWARPGGLVLGPAGDNFEYIWKMAWFVEALASRSSPTFVPHFYAPAGYELANSELTPANTLLAMPLTMLLGPVAAYNALLYLSYLLSALFTLLLARRLGAPFIGAIVAAMGVAFCLFRFQHTMSQITIAGSTQWIVLAFYGWEGFLQHRRPRDAVITALGVAFAAWSSWYYGPTLALVLALYALLRLPPRQLPALTAAWRPLLALALTLLALIIPYAHPYLQLAGVNATQHKIVDIVRFSAEPIDFLEPSLFHPIWGEYFLRNPIGGSERVGFGLSLLVLAAVGLCRNWRSRVAWCLAGVAAAAVLFSLGPELKIGENTIPLPALLINEHVPVLQSIRVWARMSFFAQITVAMLAALAFVGFAAWRRPLQMVALLLAGGVAFESLNQAPWLTPTDARPVDRWLAEQPVGGSLVQVPDVLTGYNEYYTLFSRRPLLMGYGTFVPRGSLATLAEMESFPSLRALATMRRMEVEYVIVARDKMDVELPGWHEAVDALGGLELVYEDAGHTAYRVIPQ